MLTHRVLAASFRFITVVALGVFAALVLALSFQATPAAAVAPTGDPLISFEIDDTVSGDRMATCLTALGYSGQAGDGQEAILAPLSAIERCRNATSITTYPNDAIVMGSGSPDVVRT